MRSRTIAVAVILLLTTAGTLLVAFRPAGRAAQWQDDGSDGASDLVTALSEAGQVRVLESSLALLPNDAQNDATLFLFPTYRSPAAAEVSALAEFVNEGGRLVIAADGAQAIRWGEAFGFKLQGLPVLLGPGQNDTCVPFALPFEKRTVTACLPSPSAFAQLEQPVGVPALTFEAVGNSTVPLWLDLDADGELGTGDQGPAAYPLALHWNSGEGEIIAISDADLWRNSVVDRNPENLDLARALRRAGGVAYLDATAQTGSGMQAMSRPAYQVLGESGIATLATLVLILGAVVSGLLLAPRAAPWRSHDPPRDASDEATEATAKRILQQTLAVPRSPATTGSERQ